MAWADGGGGGGQVSCDRANRPTCWLLPRGWLTLGDFLIILTIIFHCLFRGFSKPSHMIQNGHEQKQHSPGCIIA